MAVSRRKLLGQGGLLAAGAAVWPSWVPRMVFRKASAAPRGDVLVVVFLRGGADGLNMVIPYLDETEYFRRRPTVGIPAPDSGQAGSAFDLNGDFGMHPVLYAMDQGGWEEWWKDGSMAIVHAAHMDDPTRSHFDAMDFMERGTPGEKRLHSGWLNRHLSTMATQNESPFRAVGFGTILQDSLRGEAPAVSLQSIADFHLQGRTQDIEVFQQHLESLYSGEDWLDLEGQKTFGALQMLAERIPDPGGYQASYGAQYGNSSFHQGLRTVAQLVKADVGLEAATVDIGGWDTHANQVAADNPVTGNMANRMLDLASGISAFLTDVRDFRDDPGITLVTMSEFGRRAFENANNGTDHGHANAMFAFGNGINGGLYTNPWPGLADEDLYRGDLAGTTEYRDVLAEILERRVGNPQVEEVFPGKAFDYLGIAEPRVVPPTPTSPPPPTATPEPKSDIFLPSVSNNP